MWTSTYSYLCTQPKICAYKYMSCTKINRYVLIYVKHTKWKSVERKCYTMNVLSGGRIYLCVEVLYYECAIRRLNIPPRDMNVLPGSRICLPEPWMCFPRKNVLRRMCFLQPQCFATDICPTTQNLYTCMSYRVAKMHGTPYLAGLCPQ